MAQTHRSELFQSFLDKLPVQTTHGDIDLAKEFATNVFTDAILRNLIGDKNFEKFQEVRDDGLPLPPYLADLIATAMKAWATSKGVTHYTHWFLPLTNGPAEKHDSFLEIDSHLQPLAALSGKILVRMEPDASSFPSGGLRETSQARGYTVWDMSSMVFIRESVNGKTLTIPAAFVSWRGEALDKKIPLLRSEVALTKHAVHLLNLLGPLAHLKGGKPAHRIYSTCGAEQEFFLLDRHLTISRPDLLFTNRTLFGAKPPKGQELEDHYFGKIPTRVLAYLNDVERQLYRLGIPIKTRHNEVAPNQYEVAPIFERASVALDHNMLTMEVMREVAVKHGFHVTFHEKPFNCVNGSGKHNNWSLATDSGDNLLDPTDDPDNSLRFLVFLAAVMRSVDLHGDLLRASIALAPGNDQRLGANEAPPAIVSIFLGSEVDRVCQTLIDPENAPAKDPKTTLAFDVFALPEIPRDPTDRNRTSSFAFTGNKFEFRAVGSSQSLDISLVTLNTITAESCKFLAEVISARLAEAVKAGKNESDVKASIIRDVARETIQKHYRIVFNGNGYSPEWHAEAAKRGLPILRSGPEALSRYDVEDNIKLFDEMGVMSREETVSRSAIFSESYLKQLNIEVLTLTDMVRVSILPAAIKHQQQLAESYTAAAGALGASHPSLVTQKAQLENVANSVAKLYEMVDHAPHPSHDDGTPQQHLHQFFGPAIQFLEQTRKVVDLLETQVDNKLWPFPKYTELLFYVQ